MGGTFVDAVVIDGSWKRFVRQGSCHTGCTRRWAVCRDRRRDRRPGAPSASVAKYITLAGTFSMGDHARTTNAMIERSGGPTGPLITRGFEDTLPIGRVFARTVELDEAALMDRRRIGCGRRASAPDPGRFERIIIWAGSCPLDPAEVERVV